MSMYWIHLSETFSFLVVRVVDVEGGFGVMRRTCGGDGGDDDVLVVDIVAAVVVKGA